ncbi:MAG: YfhO family protein [Limisphaerales bacterium]
MVLAAFPQVLAGLATFVARDFGVFSYPVAHYQRECFWHGELPFWNPYNNCGIPFLAQWNTMCLYPPALLYLLLPLPWALNFFCLLHLWFGGLGMYFLARRWTRNQLAASVAGVVFGFNGLSLNLLMWPSHIATFSWMPWVVLALEMAWLEGGRKVVAAALAGAMQMLAGGPETILFTWLLSLGLLGLELARGQARNSLPRAPAPELPQSQSRGRALMALRFGVVAVLVAALSAAQLLPFFDLAAHSQRELGFADASWAMPGRGWVNFLVPMAFGQIWAENMFVQTEQYWTSSYYLGVGVLLLASLAVWTARDRRVWLLLGAAIAAFFCALGGQTPAYPLLRRLISQLTLITYPVKFVTVIVFVGPLLAGFGVAQARSARGQSARRPGRRLMLLCGALLGLIGVILLWARRVPVPSNDFPATLRNGLGRAAFLAAILPVLFLLQRSTSRPRRAFLSLVLLALLWLDVWTHEPPQNPTVATDVYTPGEARAEQALQPPPVLGESRLMVSRAAAETFNYRHSRDIEAGYLQRRLGFDFNCNLLDDVPKVDGFFSLSPRESDAVLSALYDAPNANFPRLLDFLSVAHITAPGKLAEFVARPNWLPMATAGQGPVFLDRAHTARRLTQPDFDGGKVVLLPPEARALVAATRQTDARVLSRRFARRRVDLEVAAAEPSLAVLSQAYYHCWRAYVDDRPAPLLLANYAFQAVPVPAGSHHVRLVYEDRAFQIGLLCSALALLGCAAAWTTRLTRR